MALKPVPRQPDFTIDKEEWGRILLEDNSIIDLRFILLDLIITGEDILGPQVTLGHVIGIRLRSPPELMERVKDKPLTPETPPPLTKDAGYEAVGIKKVEKPTRSSYYFEEHALMVELSIGTAARNMNYRSPNGGPLYNIRWTLKYNVSKAKV